MPLLIHERDGREVRVWDSLAIAEYLAELFPDKKLWPEDPIARAFARSISAEMHSGFRPLRENLSIDNLFETRPGVVFSDAAKADIARVEEIWSEARERFGKTTGGPFLFGHYTIADAMFMPVCARFRIYQAKLSPLAQAYAEAVLSDPDTLAWEAAGRREEPAEVLAK